MSPKKKNYRLPPKKLLIEFRSLFDWSFRVWSNHYFSNQAQVNIEKKIDLTLRCPIKEAPFGTPCISFKCKKCPPILIFNTPWLIFVTQSFNLKVYYFLTLLALEQLELAITSIIIIITIIIIIIAI